MTTIPSNLRRVLRREPRVRPSTEPVAAPPERVEAPPVEIAPNDPLVAYFSGATGAVDIGALQLDSPALEGLREAGIKLVVPLVSQGELIGLLNLGPRRSEQEYSADDRKLLNDLAGHAAPAVRVAQLVREQEAEVRQRERIEQELRVAQLIQQQFLPEELPNLSGWEFAAFYGPAREVGGDFYDFIKLPEGQLGIVVGDVTDKGVPAALVMATTHSILRAEAPRLIAPSEVLTRVNNLLVDEMPAHMFVTCLYAVLNPETGQLRYANAGHNVPYVSTEGGVTELRATGMPLGLLPEMEYEEKEATLAPGDTVLLHSDGLAEAHNTRREMFGFPRVASLTGEASDGEVLIDRLLKELQDFVGPDVEQEDDITLVTLGRRAAGGAVRPGPRRPRGRRAAAGRLRGGQRARQRAPGHRPGGRGGGRAGAGRPPPGAAQDGRRRGDHERHRARQRQPAGAAGRGQRGRRRHRRDGADHRPGRRACPPRGRDARPGSQAGRPPDTPRLGPVPHPEHGRPPRDHRRPAPPHHRADHAPQGGT